MNKVDKENLILMCLLGALVQYCDRPSDSGNKQRHMPGQAADISRSNMPRPP